MNAFPVEMTWASMNVEPFRDVNNLKDHGYTALSGSWPREFSKDVEKPRPTSKDSQRVSASGGIRPTSDVGMLADRMSHQYPGGLSTSTRP